MRILKHVLALITDSFVKVTVIWALVNPKGGIVSQPVQNERNCLHSVEISIDTSRSACREIRTNYLSNLT